MTIPKLKDLRDAILNDLEGALTVNIPLFGKNFLAIIAGVQAAKLWVFYLALAKVQKNIFVDTADPESTGGTLERFGRVKIDRNPFPASDGLYEIEVTGTIGAVIPASTTFKSDDSSSNPGKLFVLDDEYTLTSTTDTIQVRTLDTGSDTRMIVGDTMTSTSPIINVDKQGTIITEVEQPLEAEDIEDYRAKVVLAFQLEAQGGAGGDYRLWSIDAQGVLRVYPYARSGESAVLNLFVEATIADSIDGRGTPSQAILDDVEEVVEFDPDTTKPLNERARRPLGAFQIYFLPITVNLVDIEFVNAVGLDSNIEQNILDALTNYIETVRPFVPSADVLEDRNDLLSVNDLTAVVVDATPNTFKFDQLILKINTNPYTKFEFQNGDIPFLNSVSYL